MAGRGGRYAGIHEPIDVLADEAEDRVPYPGDVHRHVLSARRKPGDGGPLNGGPRARRALAFGADSENLEAVGEGVEAVLAADLVAELAELLAAELDDLSGRDADEVVVGLPPGDHFVVALLVVEKHLLEDAGVLEVVEGPVNGGAADAVAEGLEVVDEDFGGEEAG